MLSMLSFRRILARPLALVLLVLTVGGCGESQPKVYMPENPVPPPKPGTLKQHSTASDVQPAPNVQAPTQ
jgi:predicted small lipoprotein YifL